MGFPSFVNAGTTIQITNSTFITPPLPLSRPINNLLIAEVQVQDTGKTISVGGGWTIADSVNSGTISGAWAWRLVDGTEASPVFSWSGNTRAQAQVVQYTGNATPTPIGAFAHETADASTTITTDGIVSTADNSMVLNILLCSGSQVIPLLYDRTNIVQINNTSGSARQCYGVLNQSGETADNPSDTITSANWISFTIEVLGTGVGTVTVERASQIALQVPVTYSDVVTAAASQAVLQVPETYSTPIMSAYASQICIQVLRTVETFVPPIEAVQIHIYD